MHSSPVRAVTTDRGAMSYTSVPGATADPQAADLDTRTRLFEPQDSSTRFGLRLRADVSSGADRSRRFSERARDTASSFEWTPSLTRIDWT